MPSPGKRKQQQVKVLLVAIVVCVAFQLGRLSTWHLHSNSQILNDSQAARTATWQASSSQGTRRQIKAFIGVQTGFNPRNPQQKYNYELRRQQLRLTWFPKDRSAMQLLEEKQGLVLRFIVGHSDDIQQEQAMQQEMRRHGDFLQLGLPESYSSLAKKTLAFFTTVAQCYDAQYILKVDDDVFLRLDRVPAVVRQWSDLGADYIGCMKTGAIQTNPNFRWYEPQHALLGGKSYFAHTWGSFYVLSGRSAAFLATLPPTALRYLSNEDVTVGSWMLALNSSHYDDRRMCEPACSATSVAVYDFPKCAGLCDAVASLPRLWAMPECQQGPLDPPLQPQSWNFP